MKRIWQKEKLKVRKKQKRKRKPGLVTLIPEKAQSPNHVWTVDFVHDRLSRGGNLRLLSVVDEFTRQCLNMEWFDSLKEAQVVIEAWRDEYNGFRPHSALDYATPDQFAACWHATHPGIFLREVI